MKLYAREFGGRGIPVVILHGLFASSKNWIATARYLSGFCRPFALDLRNHGDSPHSASHTLQEMKKFVIKSLLFKQSCDMP